jgi:hypothetical protein
MVLCKVMNQFKLLLPVAVYYYCSGLNANRQAEQARSRKLLSEIFDENRKKRLEEE